MVNGSRQKNLHEVRKRVIHVELTQGITVKDQNADDLAESKQLLPVKGVLPLGRQIQRAVGCIYPSEHVEELQTGTRGLQAQHLHYKISDSRATAQISHMPQAESAQVKCNLQGTLGFQGQNLQHCIKKGKLINVRPAGFSARTAAGSEKPP